VLHARLLEGLLDNFDSGGVVERLLIDRPERPLHDAVPLRLLAGLHRLVLAGAEPALARHYPTVGGSPGATLVADGVDALERNIAAIERSLGTPVQTNEVGRAVVLMAAARWLATLGEAEFDLVEVGSSAGLNVLFDRYVAPTPSGDWGPSDSTVRLADDAVHSSPTNWGAPARVVRRWGSDPRPVDLRDEDQRLRLLSFVWPDHIDRFGRLRGAIDLARATPPRVHAASADEAVATLADEGLQRCTMVFHSIVWQYMGPAVQRRFVDGLADLAARSRHGHRLVWLRMEPAGTVADLQATIWSDTGAEELELATVGYHGAGLTWPSPSTRGNEESADLT
jgi:hypothetical protein